MNLALKSNRKVQDHYFPLRRARYAILKILIAAEGKSEDYFNVLEPECRPDAQNEEVECRKADWVEFYIEAINAGMNVDTLPDIRSCDFVDVNSIALAE